jgi:pyruvate kinase
MQELMKTKIIATIGPASDTDKKIKDLIMAGAKVFRINSSHEGQEVHKIRIETIRKVSSKLKVHIPIVFDLQGPKIRVGNLNEPMKLIEGTKVTLKPALDQQDPAIIPVDYIGIVNDVKKGDKILLDDGKIGLTVLSTTPDSISAKVIYGGTLKSRKGLNIPGTTSSISSITEKDIDFIKFAVENKIDYLALSFVRTKDDVVKARSYVHKFKGDIPIIAKIEKPQALDNLEAIIMASDGVMVARGDLGIEISPERVPIVQKQIIELANANRKEVIVATQMLESMLEEPMPTRAEASDVANAILDGTDAVMLSGETAVGKYAVEAVNMMNMIAQNTEKSPFYKNNEFTSSREYIYEVDSQATASAVIRMLTEVEIAAIVAFTKSGFTARYLSKAKPSVPIIAMTDSEKVCRKLNLSWGIFPYLISLDLTFTEGLLVKLDEMLIKETFLNAGDKIIITGGLPCLTATRTNFLRLHQIGSSGTML